jgi:hypothetical protein
MTQPFDQRRDVDVGHDRHAFTMIATIRARNAR